LQDEVKDVQSGERRDLARSMSLISRFTLLSRLLGLVREQVFAALVGAGLFADAFNIAFRIPNLLRDLFAEGALSAAFVPTYALRLKQAGRDDAHRLACRLLTLLAVVLSALVVIGYIWAGWLVDLLAPGFGGSAGKAEATVLLTRVMLPFLPIISAAAVAMGMLNAEERFGKPAMAPATFNLVTIGVGFLLWALGLPLHYVALGWAIGTLLGGSAQLLIQLPELFRAGWRFRFDWAPWDPSIRRIAKLMAPATLGLAAVQINIFIGGRFASHDPGAVAWLQYAFRVLYLPIGVFGVALGTIATTSTARHVADGDVEGLRRSLRQSLRMLAFLTLPATAGLLTLSRPIVRLIFERGRFTADDSQATAMALVCYAIGLVAYTSVKVLAPAFYGLGSPRVPLAGSIAAVTVSVTMMALLYGHVGYTIVALATSVGAYVNVLVLVWRFEKRVGGLLVRELADGGGRMLVSTALMAALAYLTASGFEHWIGTSGLTAQAVTGLVPVILGVAVYLLLTTRTRVPEAEALLATARASVARLRSGRSDSA
jgi:putative peptidoglycan lipid II flippase